VAPVAVLSVLLGQLHPRYLPDEDRTATDEAADWLKDYLEASGGEADSKDAKRAGKAAGHSERTLARAGTKLRITTRSEGFPRSTVWSLPVVPTVVPSLGEGMTCTTDSGGSVAFRAEFQPTNRRPDYAFPGRWSRPERRWGRGRCGVHASGLCRAARWSAS